MSIKKELYDEYSTLIRTWSAQGINISTIEYNINFRLEKKVREHYAKNRFQEALDAAEMQAELKTEPTLKGKETLEDIQEQITNYADLTHLAKLACSEEKYKRNLEVILHPEETGIIEKLKNGKNPLSELEQTLRLADLYSRIGASYNKFDKKDTARIENCSKALYMKAYEKASEHLINPEIKPEQKLDILQLIMSRAYLVPEAQEYFTKAFYTFYDTMLDNRNVYVLKQILKLRPERMIYTEPELVKRIIETYFVIGTDSKDIEYLNQGTILLQKYFPEDKESKEAFRKRTHQIRMKKITRIFTKE